MTNSVLTTPCTSLTKDANQICLSRWLNYSPSESSWEPEENLPKEIVDSFKNGNGDILFQRLAELTSETLLPDFEQWVSLFKCIILSNAATLR